MFSYFLSPLRPLLLSLLPYPTSTAFVVSVRCHQVIIVAHARSVNLNRLPSCNHHHFVIMASCCLHPSSWLLLLRHGSSLSAVIAALSAVSCRLRRRGRHLPTSSRVLPKLFHPPPLSWLIVVLFQAWTSSAPVGLNGGKGPVMDDVPGKNSKSYSIN